MLNGLFGRKPKQQQKKAQPKKASNALMVARDINTGKPVAHIPPNAAVHVGPIKKITICLKCNRTAMAAMQSDIKPCPACNGQVARGTGTTIEQLVEFKARWEVNMWKFTPCSAMPPYLNIDKKYVKYI